MEPLPLALPSGQPLIPRRLSLALPLVLSGVASTGPSGSALAAETSGETPDGVQWEILTSSAGDEVRDRAQGHQSGQGSCTRVLGY